MLVKLYCFESCFISKRTLSRNLASKLESGSSNKITSGRVTMALANATRCCWPPESSLGNFNL